MASVFGLTKNLSLLNVSSGANVLDSHTQIWSLSSDVDAIRLSVNLSKDSSNDKTTLSAAFYTVFGSAIPADALYCLTLSFFLIK